MPTSINDVEKRLRRDHGAIARPGNGLVLLAGHLSLLLKAMQHLDGFLELGEVHHAVGAAGVPDATDANLSCTATHIVERVAQSVKNSPRSSDSGTNRPA